MTYSKCIFVKSSRTVTSVDLGFVDSIQWTYCTSSLEYKLVRSTRQLAYSASTKSIASHADTSAIRYYLIGTTSKTVSITIKYLIYSALTYANIALKDLAIRTFAAIAAIIDHGSRAN